MIVDTKPEVRFTVIAPGGFAMLTAIQLAALSLNHALVITSACDGEHSGSGDPHHRGEAYDVRCHDLPDKKAALESIMSFLEEKHFYGFIEDAGGPNEHIHIQVRKGTTYP